MNKQEKIIESIWDELELSLTESGHPFHIFSIASINNGQPDARNVVLRGVERKKNMINFNQIFVKFMVGIKGIKKFKSIR